MHLATLAASDAVSSSDTIASGSVAAVAIGSDSGPSTLPGLSGSANRTDAGHAHRSPSTRRTVRPSAGADRPRAGSRQPRPDAEERHEAVQAKVEAAQALLAERLAALQTSDDWRRTLERMAILGPASVARLSFRNLLLLMAQRPGVTHAATFKAWQQRGRQVRKGEKGLVILRPRVVRERGTDIEGNDVEFQKLAGFSYLTVFDVEQTEGAPLPEAIRPRNLETPEGFGWTVDALREVVRRVPGVEGITLRHRGEGDPRGANGWFEVGTRRVVVILGETSPATQLKTLLHEVAHAVLHGDGERHVTATAEVEAESTAFVVAHALGLDSAAYSLAYVATWALATSEREPTKAVAAVGERVRRAAAVILATLCPDDAEVSDAGGGEVGPGGAGV